MGKHDRQNAKLIDVDEYASSTLNGTGVGRVGKEGTGGHEHIDYYCIKRKLIDLIDRICRVRYEYDEQIDTKWTPPQIH